MFTIHAWPESDGWFWDDAEDHGGFDRCIPAGPFPTKVTAVADAESVFRAAVAVEDGRPPHYAN